MAMSTTPLSLTASKCYSRLRGGRRRRGLRHGDAVGAPLLPRQVASQAEHHQRFDSGQNAAPVPALAAPREHDLTRHANRNGKREQDPPLPETRHEREQQEDDRSEEDQVAEAGVEPEAVVEDLLRDLLRLIRAFLVAELLGCVEAAVRRSRDLGDNGEPDERDPVPIDRSQDLHSSHLPLGTSESRPAERTDLAPGQSPRWRALLASAATAVGRR